MAIKKYVIGLVLAILCLPHYLGATCAAVPLVPVPAVFPLDQRPRALATHKDLFNRWNLFATLIISHNKHCGRVKKGSPEWQKCGSELLDLQKVCAALTEESIAYNAFLANSVNSAWCKLNRPLRPLPSDCDVESQDDARWARYIAARTVWCARCPGAEPPFLRDPCGAPVAPRETILNINAPAHRQASRVAIQGACPNMVQIPMTDPPRCCPQGFPYYSTCNQQCYSREAFQTCRIPCARVTLGQ